MKANLFKKCIVLTLLLALTTQCIPSVTKAATIPTTGLNAYYINVGHGDCILLQQGSEYALVDTGGEAYRSEVTNFLTSLGVSTLKYLIITHLDEDHAGNVSAIFDQFTVSNVVFRGLGQDSQNELAVDDANTKYLTRYNVIKAKAAAEPATMLTNYYLNTTASALSLGSATFKFYNKPTSYLLDKTISASLYTRVNLDSLVFIVKYSSTKIFFSGDIGTSACKYVTDNTTASEIKCNVYKTSHHGLAANNTEELITDVNPSIAINSDISTVTLTTPTTSTTESTYTRLKKYTSAAIYSTSQFTYPAIVVISNGSSVSAYGVSNTNGVFSSVTISGL